MGKAQRAHGILVRIIQSGHRRTDFTPDGTGGFTVTNDTRYFGARVVPVAGGYELKYKDGRVWTFRAFGQIHLITQQSEPDGKFTGMTRAGNGRLQSITNGARNLTFSYGANGFVSEVRDGIDRTVSYTYSAANVIETVTQPDNGVTRYSYVNDSEFAASPVCANPTGGTRLKTIQRPGETAVQTLYYGPGKRVLRETLPGGEEMRFSYTVTGACVTHTATPNTICTGPACPTVDSWDNFQAGWRIHSGRIIATTYVDGSGKSKIGRAHV